MELVAINNITIPMRKCKICNKTKPLTDYYQSSSRVQSYCIDCQKQKKTDKGNPDDWVTLFVGEAKWMRYYFYE